MSLQSPTCEIGAWLLDELARRLPHGLTLVHAPAADRTRSLHADELASIEAAVFRRRAEFSTGRWLARRGLSRLGIAPTPIRRGTANAPVWPNGVVGSLTHSASMCAFVGGLRADYLGIGLDLELSDAPGPDLTDMILSPCETGDDRAPATLRLIFSAKEAVYKCLYPICGRFLDFTDVRIEVDRSEQTFSARGAHDRAPDELLRRGLGIFVANESGAAALFTISV